MYLTRKKLRKKYFLRASWRSLTKRAESVPKYHRSGTLTVKNDFPFLCYHSIFINVADSGCLSRIRDFSIPNPNFFHPGPGSTYKNLSILTQKIVFKASWEIWYVVVYPRSGSRIGGYGSCFLPSRIPDPGAKKARDHGLRNTDIYVVFLWPVHRRRRTACWARPRRRWRTGPATRSGQDKWRRPSSHRSAPTRETAWVS